VSRYVKLLALPRPIQDAIGEKRVSMRDAACLLDRNKREREIVSKACASGMDKASLAKLIGQMRGPRKKPAVHPLIAASGQFVDLVKSPEALNEFATAYWRDDDVVLNLERAHSALETLLQSMRDKACDFNRQSRTSSRRPGTL
jgi:ParB-like chromosome segregation protein Spo0J